MSALAARPDWTALSRAERIAIMRPAVLAGASRSAIAALFTNCTASTVTGYLIRHGEAIRTGASRPAKPVRPRRGEPWHPARDARPTMAG